MWEMVNEPEGVDPTATTATFTYEQIEAWCAGRAWVHMVITCGDGTAATSSSPGLPR